MNHSPTYYLGSTLAPEDTSPRTSLIDVLQVIGLMLVAIMLVPFLE